MKTPAHSLRLLAAVAVLLYGADVARGQSACGPQGGSSSLQLPRFAGSLGSGNLSTGGGSSYLYVLTQWGFARASLADPANPSGFTQVVIAEEPGSNNGGLIDLDCDCHQGGNAFGVAEAPDGSARMISDFNASKQAGAILAPAQLARTDGSANVRFGQQVLVANGSDGDIPLGVRITAVYLPSSGGKYFGYVPTDQGVAVIDLTNTTGNTSKSAALQPASILSWTATSAVRVYTAKVTFGSSDLYLLAGSTGPTLRIATINPSTGIPTQSASIGTTARPLSLWIANVSGRIFVFSAEGTAGLKAYEYQPSQFGGTLTAVATTIPGNFDRVIVKGGQFPAIFAHNKLSVSESAIEIWDTNWVTQGGAPRKASSLPQQGSGEPFFDNSYEVVVKTSGAVTAYVYRLKSPGTQTGEALAVAQAVDISCISADLTAPPFAGATVTNLSAAGRSGAEAAKNYYGDKWRTQDNSSTAAPLDQIEWDLNVLNVGSVPTFQVDPVFSGALPNATLSDLNPVYFPCDPSGTPVGDPRTGAGCHGSVGSPGGTFDFRIGVRSHNANGWSQNPFISSALTIQAPSARIAGFADGVLRVLSGGQIDARGSDGNIADASFQWAFFDQPGQAGNNVGSPTGALLSSVPLASRSFRLTVTYKGGYVAPVLNGSIQQVDLVPDFSLSPATVLHGANLTLTNQMQKGATTTLNAVRYEISATSTPPASFSGALASGFLAAGGTAPVTAPTTDGAFFVHLQYDFSGPQGANQLLTVSKPFATTSFAPSPLVLIYRDAAGTQLASTFIPMQLSTGTTYYLFDRETLPSGVAHPGSQFYLSTNRDIGSTAGDQSLGTHAGAGPVSFAPSSTCSSNCSIKAVVGGVIGKVNVSISSATLPPPPPPPPPPPGNVNASLSCPAQGTAGTAVTCTASATGGSSYTYTWNWGDNPFGGFTSGPAANSHTYSAADAYTVTVRATSGSSSDTASASINIVPGGPPRPSAAYTVTGATVNQFNGVWEAEAGRAITLHASEPDTAATFSWAVSGGATNPVGPFTTRDATFAFTSPGSRTVTLTVTGGGTTTAGDTSTQIRFVVNPPRFQALMIPGAGHIDPAPPATDGTWATDLAVTNPGTQAMTLTLHFEQFGTTFPADLSLIPFNSVNSVPLAAGQSWSADDVVKARLGKDGRGVLILKYDGGNAEPIATATVYFTQQGRSFGSSLPTFKVGPYGTTTQAAEVATEQTLVGLRNDASYRFNVQLFNASGESGFFRLNAFGEDGTSIPIRGGNESGALDLPIGAFQQALLQSADLGLDDATKRYVLKASSVSGTTSLIAAASALDRRNNDLVQVSDDTPRITASADSEIEYFIPGVGRLGQDDVPNGPHWKTDLTLYSNSSLPRDLTFEYRYDRNGAEQRVLAPLTIPAGRSLILDDVVGTLLDEYTPADLKREDTQGVLRISYRAASDSATSPLLIGGRIYDDRGSAGTAGMQLFVYSNGESVEPGNPLVLPGAQQNLRFRTNIGFFALGDLPTPVRVTAVKHDGTVAGNFDFALNTPGQNGHFAQLPMSSIPGIVGEPMTIRVEVLGGSRIGAYVVTVDQISSDTVLVQGRPTRLAN